MKKCICGAALLLCAAALATDCASADAAGDRAATLFGPDKVWKVHLMIPARGWEVMQPTKPFPFMFGAKPADKDKQLKSRGGFAYDFEYVQADLEFDGKQYKDVGVRFKGNSTYMMSASGLKRPFKIDIDHYTQDHDFHGIETLNLANNLMDPQQLREALGYTVFRAAGVPAPRTAFVELTLTVPGKYDREFVGLYTLVENVDRHSLKNHFPKNKGMLVKPEGIQGLPYLGPDWQPYEDRFRPKKETDAKSQQRLIEFMRLVNFADDATFRKSIDQFLDVDLYLRYLAACSALVDLDSFIGTGHNYFLYLNPRDNRFVMIPWDLNNSCGGFGMMGSVDQQMDWSVKKPYLGNNRLTERILAIKDYDAGYRKHLRDLAAKGFKPETLHAAIDQMTRTIQPTLDREAKNKKAADNTGFGMMFGTAPDLKQFVSKRSQSILAQLDGKSEGKELRGGFSFGAPRPAGPGGPVVVPPHPLTKLIFASADTDKDGKLSLAEANAAWQRLFEESDTDKKGSVAEKALAETLLRILPKPPVVGFRPPGAGAPGSTQATNLAGLICYRANAKENAVVLKDLQAWNETLFRDADRNKDGFLDEKELSDALNVLSPAPPSFGAPPARPQPPAGPQPKVATGVTIP